MIDAVANFGLLEALALQGVRAALDDRRPVWLIDLDSDTILFMNAGAAGLMDRAPDAGLEPVYDSGLKRQITGRMKGDGLEVVHLRSQTAPGPTPVQFQRIADNRFPDAVWVTGLRPATRDSDMDRLWDALLARINLEGAKVMLVSEDGRELEALGIEDDLKGLIGDTLDLSTLSSSDRVGTVSIPINAEAGEQFEGVAYPVDHRTGPAVLIVGDIYAESALAEPLLDSVQAENSETQEIAVGDRLAFSLNSAGQISEATNAFRTLFQSLVAEETSLEQLIAADDLVLQSKLAAALTAEDTWSGLQCLAIDADGRNLELSLSGVPQFQPAGRLQGYRCFARVERIKDNAVPSPLERDEVPSEKTAPTSEIPTVTVAKEKSWLADLFGGDAIDAGPDTLKSDATTPDVGAEALTEAEEFGGDHGLFTGSEPEAKNLDERALSEPPLLSGKDDDLVDVGDMSDAIEDEAEQSVAFAGYDSDEAESDAPENVVRIFEGDDAEVVPAKSGLDERERRALADIASTISTAFGGDEPVSPETGENKELFSDVSAESDVFDAPLSDGDDYTEIEGEPVAILDDEVSDEDEAADPFFAEFGDFRKGPPPTTPETLALQDDLDADFTPVSDRRALARLIASNISPGEQAALLDRLPLGLVIYREEDIIFANRTALELLGYADTDQLRASGGLETVFDVDQLEHEGVQPPGSKPFRARHQSGSVIDVIARMQVIPWNGETAMLLSMQNMPPATIELHDEAVENRIEEMNAVLDIATDGIVVIDADGIIERMNAGAEALFGYSSSEKERELFTSLFTQSTREDAAIYLDELAQYGVASVLNDGREVRALVKQGGEIPVFLTVGRISTGPDAKFCAVIRDIGSWKSTETELIEAKKKAEDASAQKSDFLAKISHEIRTPLNAIIGFSEVIMEERFGPVGNARYREYIEDVHQGGRHLLSLINDLLDLSKIEAGKMDFSFTSVNLNELVQECAMIMQPDANRERIIVRTNLPSNVPPVVADSRSLKQILLNILSNGVKFTQAGGQVIASTRLDQNGEVYLTIRDTGIGMSDDEIDTALEPFRQISTSKKTGAGTGLGLPLTKALVEANRANFEISSVPDEGTTVRIVFPVTRVLAE